MDRFLIKSSSSKTTDCTFSRSFASKSFTDKKSTPKKPQSSRRLSIRDETLMKIFSTQPDQLLNDENINPELFRTSSMPAKLMTANAQDFSPTYDVFGNIGSNCQTVCEEPSHGISSERMSRSPTSSKKAASSAGFIGKEHPMYAQLQRDLNSSSANARIRAIRALRNPSTCAYTHFDVPHSEQDIITEEERRLPMRPKSIQEVMKDVVIYVEVRTGEDNRSAGVKKVISQLGAKVNDKFLRDTTHVVFKDGLQSTYNKAKKWNIPIVSILWIEACKKHMILMGPKFYPISNVERYENPELFTKMKRQKSMQPNAEENVRRNKVKLALHKETEPNKTVNISSAIRIPRKPKDKLDQIFSEFQEKLRNTPQDSEDIMLLDSKLLQRLRNSPFTPPVKGKSKEKFDSLQKYAVLDSKIDENSDDDFEKSAIELKTPEINAKKALNFDKTAESTSKAVQRRSTILPKSTPSRRSSSYAAVSQIDLNPTNKIQNQSQRTTRRSSMSSYSPFPKSSSKTIGRDDTLTINETVIIEEACDTDETHENNNVVENNPVSAAKRRATTFTNVQLDMTKESSVAVTPINRNRRRTLYTPQTMEQTNSDTDKSLSTIKRRATCFNFEIPNQIAEETSLSGKADEPILITDNCPPSLRKSRRKTMFNPGCVVEESNDCPYNEQSNYITTTGQPIDIVNDSEAAITPISKNKTVLDDLNSTVAFSSTKTPSNGRRRTIFDVSMDIIDQRLQNINKSAKQVRLNDSDQTHLTKTTLESPMKPESSDEQPVQQKQASIDSFYNSLLNHDKSKQSTCIAQTSTTITAPRKRKLFDPTEFLLNPVEPKEKKRSHEDDQAEQQIVPKKAKTDVKVVKAISRIGPITSSKTQSHQKRRSSLDFEQVNKFKATKRILRKPDDTKLNCLVCTNMHSEQINFIKEAVKKLGGFKLEDTVSDSTTHIVSLESRRTLNLLRGIIRGLWILNYNWILESMKNGKWLFEEPYEMRNFSRAVEICRSERQAFGRNYKIDLFIDLQPIYVSRSCNIPAKNIKELIVLCSGQVVKDKDSAKYLLGESAKNNPTKICLNPVWILDSISDNQIKKINKYLITD